MELEQRPPEIAKKVWNVVRILFFMMRKSISKTKLMVDLHLMMKRSKIAGKAISNLMFHHHSSLSCRSQDTQNSFFSPREYEFSCSNSPAYPSYYPFHINKRKSHHHHSRYQNHHHHNDDMTTVSAVKKVLEMLNNEIATEAAAEAAASPFPGFGRSPMVRQLRITDSPFPLKDNEVVDTQVDKAAEEFIKKFYKELKQQKKKAALESPCRVS